MRLQSAVPELSPRVRNALTGGACHIDMVKTHAARRGDGLFVSMFGWAFDPEKKDAPATIRARLIEKGRNWIVPATRVRRVDLEGYLIDPAPNPAGWEVHLEASVLRGKKLTLIVEYMRDGWVQCATHAALQIGDTEAQIIR